MYPNASYSYSKTPSTYYHKSNYNYSVARDNNVKKSFEAKYEFMKQTGYPKGRKGYVIALLFP